MEEYHNSSWDRNSLQIGSIEAISSTEKSSDARAVIEGCERACLLPGYRELWMRLSRRRIDISARYWVDSRRPRFVQLGRHILSVSSCSPLRGSSSSASRSHSTRKQDQKRRARYSSSLRSLETFCSESILEQSQIQPTLTGWKTYPTRFICSSVDAE